MKLKELSLRIRILIALVISIGFSTLLIFVLVGFYDAKEYKERLNTQASVQLLAIESSIAEVVVIGDYATLNQILKKFVLHPDTKSICFTSTSGASIEASDDVVSPKFPDFFTSIFGFSKILSASNKIIIGGQNYGTIAITLDGTSLINSAWNRFKYVCIILLVMLIVQSVLLIGLLNKGLMPSLYAIQKCSKQIGGGEQTLAIDEDVAPEIKQVLTSFNYMADAIKTQKQHLIEQNQELEIKVEAETAKRLEKERLLLQQAKMAMMGEMIGAIAHQWRQPLNAIGINVQDVYMAYQFGELDDAYLKDFKERNMSIVQKMSKTIDDFRNFFRPNQEKSNFSLEHAIEETLGIIGAQLRNHNIKINFENTSSHIVSGYQNQLEQAILILLSNAQDALKEQKIENPEISIEVCDKEPNKAILSVQDNANGVPDEIKERIFEPYFTTKEQGKGMGIGLYMAKEIVQRQMGGELSFCNANNGARFSMEFILAT